MHKFEWSAKGGLEHLFASHNDSSGLRGEALEEEVERGGGIQRGCKRVLGGRRRGQSTHCCILNFSPPTKGIEVETINEQEESNKIKNVY